MIGPLPDNPSVEAFVGVVGVSLTIGGVITRDRALEVGRWPAVRRP